MAIKRNFKIDDFRAYRISSGEIFKSSEDAIKNQMIYNLRAWADKVGLCKGGEWSQDMVIDQMIDDLGHIKNILDEKSYIIGDQLNHE